MAPGRPAAKAGDTVRGTDVHVVLVPAPGGPVPTPTPMPFSGTIDGGLVPEVVCEGKPVAVEGSTASNQPAHLAPSGSFQVPPTNRGSIHTASNTVIAGGKGVARAGDLAMTCNDPADAPNGIVVASSTVFVGD